MADAVDATTDGHAIRIGVGAPLSGNGAVLGREMTNAIRLAIDEANEHAGSAGRALEAVSLDDAGDADVGDRVARTFIADPRVVAVIGHYNSNVTLRAAPSYDRARLALIAPIVSNPKLTDSGWANVFRFTNRDDRTSRAIAGHLVRERGKRRAIVVETTTVYGQSMSSCFASAFGEAGGLIVQRYPVKEGEQRFEGTVRNFPSDADVIFYGGTFEGAPLLKAMRSHDDGRLLATGDGCWDVENFLRPAGSAAEEGEGVLVLSACPEIGRITGSREFSDRYASRFGPIGNYAVNAYDAAMLVIDAIRRANRDGECSRAEVGRALRATRRQGIAYAGTVKWDENGDNVAAVTALHTVEGGSFRQIAMIENA
jgi:branched-chain amino acid transport system substrate-binding protein